MRTANVRVTNITSVQTVLARSYKETLGSLFLKNIYQLGCTQLPLEIVLYLVPGTLSLERGSLFILTSANYSKYLLHAVPVTCRSYLGLTGKTLTHFHAVYRVLEAVLVVEQISRVLECSRTDRNGTKFEHDLTVQAALSSSKRDRYGQS